MKIIGIDPGLDGAICTLFTNSDEVRIVDMPTVKVSVGKKQRRKIDLPVLCDILGYSPQVPTVCYVEKQWSRPGKGVTSEFSTGYGYGVVLATLTCNKCPFVEVAPNTWMTKLVGRGKKTKGDIYKAAVARVPAAADLLKGPRGGIKSGRSDALMIAVYGAIAEGLWT